MSRIHHSTIAKLVLGCSLAILVSHQASAVGFIVNPTSEATGVANAGWKVWRHTFASLLAQKGVSIFKIAEFMGHEDIHTTRDYYAALQPRNDSKEVQL